MTTKEKQVVNTPKSTIKFDPSGYKNRQRQEWDKVAAGWRRWWQLFEQGAKPLSNRLVTLANLEPGQQVLDVATGVGEPAVAAARQVGPAGHVIAIDQSPQMLTIARERAAERSLHQATFLEMDAESLELPQNSFDAILCRWGLMFLPHLDATLIQMQQLLRPGGRLATAVWDVPSQVPMLSLPMRVVRQHLQLPPPPADVPNPFNLANVAGFEQRLTQAGFSDISSERMTLYWEFSSAAEFVNMTRDLAAPVTALLSNQPIGLQNEIWQGVAEAVQQYELQNGRICVPSKTISIVGERN